MSDPRNILANPRRLKPTTAMTFPGLRSSKDIDDVIAYITGAIEAGGAQASPANKLES